MTKEETKGHHHRSSLKQKNKPFKGGNASRSKSRGRVDSKRGPTPTPHDLNRKERRNRMSMIQQQKRTELTTQRRMYAGKEGMARIIAVVPITAGASLEGFPFPLDSPFYSESNRQNLLFIGCSRNATSQEQWIRQIIDVAQVADCFCFLASAEDEDFDQFGLDAFSLLRAIGLSSAMALVQNRSSSTAAGKQKNLHQAKSTWLTRLQTQISTVSKVFCQDSALTLPDSRELVELERTLCHHHLNGISWRDVRPYMLTESMEIVSSASLPDCCRIKVTGFMRGGKPFSANRLAHIPSLGENFIISKIENIPSTSKAMDMDFEPVIPLMHVRDDMEGDHLDGESAGDPFSAEALQQIADRMTMESSVAAESDDKRIKVPLGTLSYQAAWLEGEDFSAVAADEEQEEHEQVSLNNESTRDLDNQMDLEEHNARLQEHRELQFNQRHFPDEIDLDPSISARTRLQRYRGVQSLRNSTWDANENLPVEYSRIFRFANYKHSRKLAIEENDSPLSVGQRVAMFIENVPVEQASRLVQSFIIFGLFRYEQKQTVVNFSFTVNKTAAAEPLLNKQELMAVVGSRKFMVNPIFSEHSTTTLHKMMREVDVGDGMVVGTIYAPVTFTPSPVLLFSQQAASNRLELVGSGSVLDTDTQRIILKRITLTGSPFRVHKRAAVVRFMFSNPPDINWFKPVELVTRAGARGHIRESLGTHGYMKCLFDKIVFHHDTVAMHLYKRVFPKRTTRPYY